MVSPYLQSPYLDFQAYRHDQSQGCVQWREPGCWKGFYHCIIFLSLYDFVIIAWFFHHSKVFLHDFHRMPPNPIKDIKLNLASMCGSNGLMSTLTPTERPVQILQSQKSDFSCKFSNQTNQILGANPIIRRRKHILGANLSIRQIKFLVQIQKSL